MRYVFFLLSAYVKYYLYASRFVMLKKKNAVIDWMCVLYINRYIYLRSVGNLEYVRDVTLF